MAIELTKTTKILAGVVVLAAAGAGAWFFYLQDLLDEPPPAKVAAAPAKAAPKGDAPKADAARAEPGKPAAEAGKPADAPKPAATAAAGAAKPAAKPIPTDPDKLVAEVIETSGIKTQFQSFSRETMLKAGQSEQAKRADPAEYKQVMELIDRAFEPGKMSSQLAVNLKTGFNAERMARFLELLREPIAVKMNSKEMRNPSPEAMAEFSEGKKPPAAARVKLVQTVDDVTHTSAVATEHAGAIARSMVDTMLADMQKAGKAVPKEARQAVGSQLNAMRGQAKSQIRSTLFVMYRDASDQELAEYVKLLDTDTGRWGMEQLANAVRPILVERGNQLGREVAQLAMAKRAGAMATAPAPAAAPVAKAPAEKAAEPVAKVAAAPAEPIGYKRAPGTRELYSRYNDLLSAAVMRDRSAVKELLDDGKFPNVRQRDGTTPLMIAASNGDAEIASMLLAKGADPNLRATGGVSALSLAKERGAAGKDMVQLLQRSGAKD
jgi:ankyrin repeat protein